MLQARNPNISTLDWKILHVFKPTEEGQTISSKLSKKPKIFRARQDVVGYRQYFLSPKIRISDANDDNLRTLKAGEVEKDFGFILTDLKIMKVIRTTTQ